MFANPVKALKSKTVKPKDNFVRTLYKNESAADGEVYLIRGSKNFKGSPAVFVWKKGTKGSVVALLASNPQTQDDFKAVADTILSDPDTFFAGACAYSDLKAALKGKKSVAAVTEIEPVDDAL